MNNELKDLIKKYYDWEGLSGESFKEMYFSGEVFERYEHRFRLDTALRLLNLRENEKILDLGCAEGYVTYQLAGISTDVTGMEISEIKLGKTSIAAQGFLPKAAPKFVCADANERLPFDDNTFDAVLCLEMLEHTIDPPHVVNEIGRILKPNGRAIISLPTWSQYSWIHAIRKKKHRQASTHATKPIFLANQFEQPFEGHIWNFTLASALNMFTSTSLRVRRKIGAVAFDFPFFSKLRRQERHQNMVLKIQAFGDKLCRHIPGSARFSRYIIFEVVRKE